MIDTLFKTLAHISIGLSFIYMIFTSLIAKDLTWSELIKGSVAVIVNNWLCYMVLNL